MGLQVYVNSNCVFRLVAVTACHTHLYHGKSSGLLLCWTHLEVWEQGGLGGEASGENFGGLKAILSMLIQIKQFISN